MKIIKKILLIFIGIILSLLVLEIGLQTVSYVNKAIKDNKINKQLKNKDTIKILCLGESTTDGQWPPVLQKILNKKSKNKKFNVIDEGHGSCDTDYLMQEIINKKIEIYKPDIIISMMGINDDDNLIKKLTNFNFKTIKLIYLIIKHIKNINVTEAFALEINNNNEEFKYYYNKAINEYYTKNYDEALTTLDYLNEHFPERKADFCIYEFLIYKNGVKSTDKLKKAILELSEINPYLAVYDIVEFCCKTNDTELLKTCYLNNDNDEAFRKNIDQFITFRTKIEDIGLQELVDKIDEQTNILLQTNEFDINTQKINMACVYGFYFIQEYMNRNYYKADIYFNMQTKFLCAHISKKTFNNYKNLIQICKEHNIKLMAMQYPVRSVKSLKYMLGNFNNITFISNEENFKKELKNHKTKEIFMDMFGGNFPGAGNR